MTKLTNRLWSLQRTGLCNNLTYQIRSLCSKPEPGVFKDKHLKVDKKQVKILYDGECPLCVAEIDILKKFNKRRNDVYFHDITSGEYKPEEHSGIQYKDAMAAMHVIGKDGKIYTKMDAVRELYKGVGLGFVATLTSIPGFTKLLDKGYDWFAINRYKITGRDIDCETGRCRIKNKKS